jgi:thiamine-phosphate pyrophosphorylase
MDVICVTNKKIAEENSLDFYALIERIARERPKKIILREKYLSEEEYEIVAEKCIEACRKHDIDFVVNKFIKTAINLNIKSVHLSFKDFFERKNELSFFERIGVSVHSAEEAASAEKNGACYVIAGHIFKTDCKKGVLPRGIKFLEDVLNSVTIPVYAIGGITALNVSEVRKTSASGVCLMSSLMKSENPFNILESIKNSV